MGHIILPTTRRGISITLTSTRPGHWMGASSHLALFENLQKDFLIYQGLSKCHVLFKLKQWYIPNEDKNISEDNVFRYVETVCQNQLVARVCQFWLGVNIVNDGWVVNYYYNFFFSLHGHIFILTQLIGVGIATAPFIHATYQKA